ncbi:glycosyltransferase family protein [Sphingobacterium corticibacter]|uniref:Glycosyl transferase family 1 n=1 Tax=Sphingobacterium corticibacter TaxID=2171749 RepID=A0A2T8HKB0_9SPHI|nr:glycosyltransferase [Sphingobacterium corticibacter]PVH25835.1 glycosyl transferase family 1 [Sphingobacterium corticibacter]
MILFLATYPTESSEKDGMVQRIASIDAQFADRERAYLTIYNRKKTKKIIERRGLLTLYSLSLVRDFFLILRLFFSASNIYIHSLYNVPTYVFFFLYLVKRPIILDVHGVVPEENEFMGYHHYFEHFKKIEERLFKMSNLKIVTITDAMTKYYKEKYPNAKFSSLKYSIFPAHLQESPPQPKPIEDETINFVYAGNLQKWQNAEMMLESIAKLARNSNYHFYILTGELEEMVSLVREKIGEINNVEVLSVSPTELKNYYEKCHYGFVLRDDIIVNRVACPTKLIEYMFYGITPIVLSENMGDFNSLGYEFVRVNELNNLKARKSTINIEIIKKMQVENRSVNFRSLL